MVTEMVFPCQWCNKPKTNPDGLCPYCCKFPSVFPCLLCGLPHEPEECHFFDTILTYNSGITEDDIISWEFQEYLDWARMEGEAILEGQAKDRQKGSLDGLEAIDQDPEVVEEGSSKTACTALILRPLMALAPIYHLPAPKKNEQLIPIQKESPIRLQSLSGRFHAYQFQAEGVDFIHQTGFKCLIGDKMGLGKTVQAILALANDQIGDKLPSLYVVRSSTVWQWLSMHKEWGSSNPLGIFMIRGSKNFIPAGFGCYVLSMDTLGRLVEFETDRWGEPIPGSEKLNHWLEKLGIKSVVVDECHSFKNTDSKRSKALEIFLRLAGIKYEIYLSGTAIKNRADEYYFTLHRLFPDYFPTLESFRNKWCERDEKGKWSRIKPRRLEEFRSLIAGRVLRREKGKDLPPFRRTTITVSIENPKFKAQYNKALDELQETMDKKDKVSARDVQDNLMVLRRIVGNAKVDDAIEYVDEFLDENEEEKIVIGVHHHSVRDTLYAKLIARGHQPLKLSGEDSADAKNNIIQQFKRKENRVLIISIIAGGTGIDGLQICSNILVLERQWNCADEEQFEFRFNRDGQVNPVLAQYMIARGTVDDFFTKNVERTRVVFHETVGNDYREDYEDKYNFREDMDEILRNRL